MDPAESFLCSTNQRVLLWGSPPPAYPPPTPQIRNYLLGDPIFNQVVSNNRGNFPAEFGQVSVSNTTTQVNF